MHILESAQHVAPEHIETRKETNEKEVVEDKEKQSEKSPDTETTKVSKRAKVRAEDSSKSKSSNSKSSEEEKPKVRESPAVTTPKVAKHKEAEKSAITASKSRESVDDGISNFNTKLLFSMATM